MSTNENDPPISILTPRVRSAILWGAVGCLTFLVLVQGYALYDGPIVSIGQGVGIALVVGSLAGVGAYVLEHRVAEWAAERTRDRKR